MRAKERAANRAKANRQALKWPIGVGGALLIGVIAFYQVGTEPAELDDRLCPKQSGPVGATLLLIDTSDPFSAKHKETLIRFFDHATDPKSAMPLGPEELLLVYELTEDPGDPARHIEICRPGMDFNDRTWRDDIRQGRKFAERDWDSFNDKFKAPVPHDTVNSRSTSPIIETLGVLAARHVPGKLGNSDFKVHIVLFSDLLQHSPRMSHYGSYPKASEMALHHRDLLTDLTGADVSIFRLERPKYASWQTADHYYWWTEFVAETGGNLRFQDSI